jgi:hypothetical protein
MTDETKPQDGKAMSPASAGSQPVAWAALNDDGDIAWIGYTEEGAADGSAGRPIVPLYRSPPTCPYVVGRTTLHCSLTPLTLTDEEREALEWAEDASNTPRAAAIRGLLKRLG